MLVAGSRTAGAHVLLVAKGFHIVTITIVQILAQFERGEFAVHILVGVASTHSLVEEDGQITASLELDGNLGRYVFFRRKQPHAARRRNDILGEAAAETGIEYQQHGA